MKQKFSKTATQAQPLMSQSLGYPVTFVIFGATGDLAEKKLFPALFHLYRMKLLPNHFKIVAFARRPFTDESFGQLVAPRIVEAEKKDTRVYGQDAHVSLDEKGAQEKFDELLKSFLSKIVYHQGLFEETKSYVGLINRLGDIDKDLGACSHKIFHLALSPFFYETVLKNLEASALNLSCTDGTGLTRILIEKPIGTDLASARKINALLSDVFKEEQIFRVDHYLTKNALYSLLTSRFGVPSLSSVWNDRFIKYVQLSLQEKVDAEGRGVFYDKIGAFRDIGQNHLLEMLSLLLCERLPGESDRDKRIYRARALDQLRSAEIGEVKSGQYDGYLKEEGVAADSKTETYFWVPFSMKEGSWKDTVFVLESGKALEKPAVFVEVAFREPVSIFINKKEYRIVKIVFNTQPVPSTELYLEGGEKVAIDDLNGHVSVEADNYELVYLESLKNDQTRFVSKDEVEASWLFTDRVIEALHKVPLKIYAKGADPRGI